MHYALNLRDAARNEFERNMERRYDFRCRRKPKCSKKTCAGKYGSRNKFTYDCSPTGNRTRAALVKGTRTTAVPTRPPKPQSEPPVRTPALNPQSETQPPSPWAPNEMGLWKATPAPLQSLHFEKSSYVIVCTTIILFVIIISCLFVVITHSLKNMTRH